MKQIFASLALVAVAMSASADTLNEKVAQGVLAVLQSNDVKQVMMKDQSGTLSGINYIEQARLLQGGFAFEVYFSKTSAGGIIQTCTLQMIVSTDISSVRAAGPLHCN